MEGERRKRKMEKMKKIEDEEEEEKMNEFFALIRRTREVRERLITTSSAVAGEHIQNPPPRPPASAVTPRVWNLAFQAEDFADPCHKRAAVAAVNRSKIAIDLESPEVGPSNGEGEEPGKIVEKEEEEEEEEEDNEKEREELDLNLSL